MDNRNEPLTTEQQTELLEEIRFGDGKGQPAPTGKLLALDVGLARIGVAVCDPLQLGVRPVGVIRRHSRNEDFAQIAALVREQLVEAVICGLPLNMDGTEGEQARTTRKWAMRLAQALRTLSGQPVAVIFWDERLSTFAAQEILAATRQKTAEDAVAAAVLLQSYLDAKRLGEQMEYGRIELPEKAKNGHSKSAPVAAGPTQQS